MCGLLWCFYQLFELWFWRHPFTAEHPFLGKWCNGKFLQICSDEETNSSWIAWGWVNFQQNKFFGWTIPLIEWIKSLYKIFIVSQNTSHTGLERHEGVSLRFPTLFSVHLSTFPSKLYYHNATKKKLCLYFCQTVPLDKKDYFNTLNFLVKLTPIILLL